MFLSQPVETVAVEVVVTDGVGWSVEMVTVGGSVAAEVAGVGGEPQLTLLG